MRETKGLMVICLIKLFIAASSLVQAGVGNKWWTPDYVNPYLTVSVNKVYGSNYLYWKSNQYEQEEQRCRCSLSYIDEYRTDYNMLEGDGWYFTNLPQPITYTNSNELEERYDGYEEV